jgi:hypothetical protein
VQRSERVLYHQIHPVKLGTDVGTALVATVLFWQHRPGTALLAGFVPSLVVSAALLRWVDLARYRASALGRYVHRFTTRGIELARLAGLLPLWGGAWLRSPALIAGGVAWILACWLWGLSRPPSSPPAA